MASGTDEQAPSITLNIAADAATRTVLLLVQWTLVNASILGSPQIPEFPSINGTMNEIC